MNPQRLRQRAAVTSAIRDWFAENGYLEVHTPCIVDSPALEEHLEAIQVDGQFLHTSPEFAMKRILASGLCRVYQICPCFREEENGIHHSREFTMVEWYRTNAGTAELMNDAEELVGCAARSISVNPPVFHRRSVEEIRHTVGLKHTDDEVEWFRGWVSDAEPSLDKPTIVYDYPGWQAALAQERHNVADRFEMYLNGIEIGNCFAEETHPNTLRSRFDASAKKRHDAGKEPHPTDEKFLAAMDQMPRAAGMAIGLDRLVMALTGAHHIRDVQFQ